MTRNGLLKTESTTTVDAPTQYFHDDLGRTVEVGDPEGFSTFTTYEAGTGLLATTRRPPNAAATSEYFPVS